MKLYEQAPGLYTRGTLRDSQLDAIRELRAAVVCVAPSSNLYLQKALTYRHHPLSDGRLGPVALVKVVRVVRAVLELWAAGPVIVHCNAGRNRAPLVAALVLYATQRGLSGEGALAHVRAVRPNAIANAHFEAYLRSLP